MTFADCCTYCLAGLLACAILHRDILVRARPCLLLVASGFEDALIGEDEVAAFTNDLVDLVPQLDGQVGVLLVQLVLLLRHILGLDLLKLEAIEFQNLAEVLRLDDTIRKLPMEQPSSLG